MEFDFSAKKKQVSFSMKHYVDNIIKRISRPFEEQSYIYSCKSKTVWDQRKCTKVESSKEQKVLHNGGTTTVHTDTCSTFFYHQSFRPWWWWLEETQACYWVPEWHCWHVSDPRSWQKHEPYMVNGCCIWGLWWL